MYRSMQGHFLQWLYVSFMHFHSNSKQGRVYLIVYSCLSWLTLAYLVGLILFRYDNILVADIFEILYLCTCNFHS